jgi:hypothetical protein
MRINVETETLIDFASAAREFPGRAVCIQTLHRWRLRGVRGAKLESCLIGGRRFTSHEAVARFVAAQNADESPPTISKRQRAKQSAAARRELERFNV